MKISPLLAIYQRAFGAVALIGTLGLGATAASAADFVVTNTADSGAGSLRQAILDSEGNGNGTTLDTISFSPTFDAQQQITLTTGQFVIASRLQINGPAAKVTITTRNASRAFLVSDGAELVLERVNLVGAATGQVQQSGGGILNSGLVTLRNSSMRQHGTLFGGGAISNGSGGRFAAFNSVFDSNRSPNGDGASIFNGAGSRVELTDCVVSASVASGEGGGVRNLGTLIVSRSSLNGNSARGGSGISTDGTATLTNTTLTSAGDGVLNRGTLRVESSTISINGSGSQNAIASPSGTVTINNSIAVTVKNAVPNTSFNPGGSNNILSGTPARAGLETDANGFAVAKDNGGATPTVALSDFGPAIDAGNDALLPSGVFTDGRGTGYARITGEAVDIGAFEFGSVFGDPTGAGGLVVTTNADSVANDGLISLREAISNANGDGVGSAISFDAAVFRSAQIVEVGAALPAFTSDVTVTGSDAGVTLSASSRSFVIFTVGASVNASINRLNIMNGGTGIRNDGGTLTVTNTFVSSNNTAINAVSGSLAVTNATLSRNNTGISISSGSATVTNSTLAYNFGDGISNGGSLTLSNSLVIENASRNVVGGFTDGGGNRTTGTAAEVNLDTVSRFNGGPTQTLAIFAGSPTINAGSNALIPSGVTTDQRGAGFPRIVDGTVDIGAFELDATPPTVVSITRLDANPTNFINLRYSVLFSETVTGVGTGDFTVATTGTTNGASVSAVSGGGAVYTVTVGNVFGTGTVRLDVATSATISDVSGNALVGGFNLGEVYTRNDGNTSAATPATSGAILSEFRHRGPGGSGDEFVEIVNTTTAPLQIGGWSVQTRSASGLQTSVVPQNTVLPARGHFLFTGGAFGLTGYATGDALLSGDALDASGVALFNAEATPVKQDAVGFTASDAALKEGTALASAPIGAPQGAFTRLFTGTLPKDSNDNTADFVFVVSDGTLGTPDVLATVAGTSGNVAAQLGAPSPKGLTSPTNINVGVTTILFDSGAGVNVSPNRVRVGTGNSGTLLIRRTLLNKTGRDITKIRFSVTRITSLGTPVTLTNQADIRLITSSNETAVARKNGTTGDVFGTTLESGAGQPAQPLGGALGSSVILNLGTPLPANESRTYSFLLSIKKSGNFAVSLNIEALPNP